MPDRRCWPSSIDPVQLRTRRMPSFPESMAHTHTHIESSPPSASCRGFTIAYLAAVACSVRTLISSWFTLSTCHRARQCMHRRCAMGFVWVHADSFLHSVAPPFHSFVTICILYVSHMSAVPLMCNRLSQLPGMQELRRVSPAAAAAAPCSRQRTSPRTRTHLRLRGTAAWPPALLLRSP